MQRQELAAKYGLCLTVRKGRLIHSQQKKVHSSKNMTTDKKNQKTEYWIHILELNY